MEKKKGFIKYVLALTMFICISISVTTIVYGTEEVKVMAAYTVGDHIKAYVRGGTESADVSYQIGNIQTEKPDIYSIADDSAPMRTLIMLDNSFSIPKNSRDICKTAIKEIINGHNENEQFRIATFSENANYLSDKFSDDYTALGNMVDTIDYKDQDTKLTDVLYSVLSEFNDENYSGYTRIIIISDGVNDKDVGGITLGQIRDVLKEKMYPIYTIGIVTKDNDSLLDDLFSLSWDTKCEHVVLNDSSVEEVKNMSAADNSIMVYDAIIPENAKTGGIQSSQLTLSDGNTLKFDVEMPFSIAKEEEKEEVVPEVVHEEETPAPITEEDDAQPATISKFVMAGAVVGLLLIAITIAIIIIAKSANKKKSQNVAPVKPLPSVLPEKTEIIDERQSNGTVIITPDGISGGGKTYSITLVDCADVSRSFRCQLVDSISVGRTSDNQISISDDTTVHSHHCNISVNNDSFYITDLKTVKNKTAVNGIKIRPEIPQLITNNTKITIGRHTYIFTYSEV